MPRTRATLEPVRRARVKKRELRKEVRFVSTD